MPRGVDHLNSLAFFAFALSTSLPLAPSDFPESICFSPAGILSAPVQFLSRSPRCLQALVWLQTGLFLQDNSAGEPWRRLSELHTTMLIRSSVPTYCLAPPPSVPLTACSSHRMPGKGTEFLRVLNAKICTLFQAMSGCEILQPQTKSSAVALGSSCLKICGCVRVCVCVHASLCVCVHALMSVHMCKSGSNATINFKAWTVLSVIDFASWTR